MPVSDIFFTCLFFHGIGENALMGLPETGLAIIPAYVPYYYSSLFAYCVFDNIYLCHVPSVLLSNKVKRLNLKIDCGVYLTNVDKYECNGEFELFLNF